MITVKDIRDKEFKMQKQGYSEEEVDDFLDEIAEQMEALIRENRALITQLDEAKAAAVQVSSEPVQVVPAPVAPPPSADDSSYFKGLETVVRETLTNAQRVADATITEARAKAKELLSGGEEQAKKAVDGAKIKAHEIVAEASAAANSARADLDGFKKAYTSYKARAVRLIQEHMAALKIDDEEIDPEA